MTSSFATLPKDTPTATAASLRPHFRGSLVLPGDAAYDEARHVWNGMVDRHPALIARCEHVDDVRAVIACARERGLPLAVRGGGHNAAGFGTCDGGVVLDLSPMHRVDVDVPGRRAFVQGGATWADVDRATQPHGLATPGGAVSDTGVGGLTLGGGFGNLRRKLGLSCDNVLDAEVVTADGAVVHANAGENRDLFWALRGGGGNFGVVTRFTFRLHEVGPEVVLLGAMFNLAEADKVVNTWTRVMASAPDEFSCNCFYWSVPAAPSMPEALHGQPVVALMGTWAGDVQAGMDFIAPFRTLARPLVDMSGVCTYVELQQLVDPFFPRRALHYYWRSLNLRALPPAAMQELAEWASRRPSPMTLIDLWAMGGAVGRVPADATAFGDRSAPFVLVMNTSWVDPADTAANVEWTRALARAMEPYATGSTYLNFPGLEEDARGLVPRSFGANYRRLVQVKRTYDPDNLFRLNQNILPGSAGVADEETE